MLAFSIIMWFCSIVLCFFAVRLIIGDASPVQQKTNTRKIGDKNV